MRRVLTLSITALGAVGCVPDFDTDLSELREPRLLAISASPAETQAGKTTTLSALVAVPEGAKAPRVDWSMCLARKPLTELGPINPACLEPDDGSGAGAGLGGGDTVTATLDRDACKLFGPLRPSPMAGQPAGRPVDPDISGGFYQPFVARLGQVTSLGSVRLDCDLANVNRDQTVLYRQQYRVNENPRISELARQVGSRLEPLAGDDSAAPAAVGTAQSIVLRASWNDCPSESVCGDGLCTANEDPTSCAQDCSGAQHGCSGAEPYVWYDRQLEHVEPRREGISVAWYASRGHFASEQTGLDETEAASASFSENTWLTGSSSGPATLWVVIRDTRGGQSWQTYHFEVTP